jgi:hypothetical protein
MPSDRNSLVSVPSVASWAFANGEAIVIAQRNEPDGTKAITVGGPRGWSENRIDVSGVCTLAKHGRLDAGRACERQVCDVLIEVIAGEGHEVSYGSRPPRDADGEDAVLMIGGREYAVQITAPSADGFWRPERAGTETVSPETAQGWIRKAILRKQFVPVAARANVILAIDARHLTILSPPQSVLAEFPQKRSEELGWAGVYLVGPLPDLSCPLVRLAAGIAAPSKLVE